jgi:predicted anti-sigma-YlaC factor YlaD
VVGGLVLAEHGHQVHSRPRDPGSDGADGASDHLGGLVVAQAQHLGEYERGLSIGFEPRDQIIQFHLIIVGWLGKWLQGQTSIQLSPPGSSPGGIGTGTPSDGEDPMASRALGPVPVQRTDGTLVGLLGQIIHRIGVTQIPAHVPDLGAGFVDEALECVLIAVAGVHEQAGQVVHPVSIAAGTSEPIGSTVTCMQCEPFRELISAAIDDELSPSQRWRLDTHLESCAPCATQFDAFSDLTRRIRVRPAEPVPDLAARVMDRARPPRLGRGGWLRPALAWVAAVIAVQSLGPLVWGSIDGVTTHAARHLGGFALALAVGLAYAAWRPHRAFGMLPFAVALVVTILIGATLDLASGASTALAEALHLTELLGLVLLWLIAGSPGWERLKDRVVEPSRRPVRT